MTQFSCSRQVLFRIFSCVFAFAFTTAGFFASAQRAVPDLANRRVHDEAGVLSKFTIDALEEKLRLFEDTTSNQIAILVISSLGQEEPEQYAFRVAREWELGTKGNDNGVLLFIAVDDRKMNIQVGRGLEGALPDVVCGRIIRNEMAPNFRRGDYDTGVNAAIDAIVLSIKGEYQSGDLTEGGLPWFVGVFFFLILRTFTFKALFTKGCAGWGLYGFLAPFYAILPGVFLNSIAAGSLFVLYLIAFPILKVLFGKSAWGQRIAENMATSSRRGSSWTSSGGFLGGGGGSWGGGGGFSGGGGSFGGGGASGSW